MNLTKSYKELSSEDSKQITESVIPLGDWLVGSYMAGYTVQSGYWKRK
ncbi:hypothetical protein AB3I41_12385 [Enterococcus sp. C42(2024)]|nr:hypothetical protein [Enterococcus faecium]EMF0364665.1 hypothetical protein [Enterococcus faecium]EMF0403474.1 hypothetical protein [Enterococcus faecium]NTK30353.1 hypothetical protein [Enterococcus faecium]